MARKREINNSDDSAKHEDEAGQSSEPFAEEPDAEAPEEHEHEATSGEAVSPTEGDLESQGFTPDEVRRLMLISDQLARSQESQDAEAELRRLRFARWLIERGVLDEWSA
jgi:hypothetical protein